MMPGDTQIGKATENLFVIEDWHNLCTQQDKILMAWNQNFLVITDLEVTR